MSKHSKWAKIKRQKAATDNRRGKIFSRLSRSIITAAATGGADPQKNIQLRMAIDTALANNMPKDSIDRAIRRGAGDETGGQKMETVLLEGYGPGGTPLIISAVTASRNRVIAAVRHTLHERGGSLGEAGSTQWMFEQKGRFVLDRPQNNEVAELEAIDEGAEETRLTDDGNIEVFTPHTALASVAQRMKNKGYNLLLMDIMMVPKNTVAVSPDVYKKLSHVIDELEHIEDVVAVETNARSQKQ